MIWITGVCFVCLGICMPLFMYYKKSLRLSLGTAYKCLGTLCPFLLALIAAIRLDPHCYICALAILIYAVADGFLEYSFFAGAGIFLAGHICAIAFFLNLSSVSAVQPVCFLLLGGLMVLVYYRWKKIIGKQMTVFVVYGISLIAMCSCAVGCFMLNNLSGILITCGGALFFISDSLLLRRTLFPSARSVSWAIMVSYYSSLLLFGIACLHI